MHSTQIAILDILRGHRAGLSQREIHELLVTGNSIQADADLAGTFHHLRCLIRDGYVFREEQVRPKIYRLDNDVPEDGEIAFPPIPDDPEEADSVLESEFKKSGFDAICRCFRRNGNVGGSDVVVIPGNGRPPCLPKVIVLVNHSDNHDCDCWTEMDRVVSILKKRLIRCLPTTRQVHIWTDRWDADAFEQRHGGELEEFVNVHGIKIIIRVMARDRRQSALMPFP